MPDIEAQRAFLAHILPPPAPGQSYFYAWKVPDNPNDWHQKPVGTLEEIVAASNQLAAAGLDTYFATGVFNGQGVRTQANSLGAKALWADIDVGAGKPYAAIADALPGLIALCKDHRLPAPTLVQSGGGLHCYWVLDRVVDAAEWLGLAERLRAAARRSGLSMDPKPVCNIAGVLRLPGTQNYKRAAAEGHGRPVTVGPLQPPIGVDYLLQHLPAPPPDERAPGRAAGSVSPDLQKYLAWTDAEEAVYADDVADRCQWVRTAGRDKRGNVSEPEWYALLGLVQFLDDADAVAEEWSDGHPTFSKEETAKKLAQARERQEGPTTCRYFESLEPKGCQGCPVRGQITTPLQLGRGKWLDMVQPQSIAVSVGVPAVPPGGGSNGFVIPPIPTIRLVEGERTQAVRQLERAIVSSGRPIYARGERLVRVVTEPVAAMNGGKTWITRLTKLTTSYAWGLCEDVATWKKWSDKAKDFVPKSPPKELAEILLARDGEWCFEQITGVLMAPTIRADGSLLDRPGHDRETMLYLAGTPAMPGIPDNPTWDDARAALNLLEGLLEEFAIAAPASRSVALSALITPVVRGAFDHAPLHACRAPMAGTGKSYLFDVASMIAAGQRCPVIAAAPGDKNETEKRIHGVVMTGQSIISIDNINGPLDSDTLSQILERSTVQIRVFSTQEMRNVQCRATFFATGNNIQFVGDLNRRVIMCTMDAASERPERRHFRRSPVAEVAADRGKYVAAALIVCRAYIAAGRPDMQLEPFASFDGWTRTVRSALVWLGEADPVKTLDVVRQEDPRLQMRQMFFTAMAETIGVDRKLTAGELIAQGAGAGIFRDALVEVAGGSNEEPRAKLLAKWLSRNRDVIVSGFKLSSEHDLHSKQLRWFIKHTG